MFKLSNTVFQCPMNRIPEALGSLQCKIFRSNSACTKVKLFIQSASGESVLRMSARKNISGFTISKRLPNRGGRTKKTTIASLKSQQFRTKYTIFKSYGTHQSVGQIHLSTSRSGSRKSAVIIPEKNKFRCWKKFDSVTPRYCSTKKLDFGGRHCDNKPIVTSVKNTLIRSNGRSICSIAKVGQNEFNLNMAWPLSPLQAFAFGIASLNAM